MMTSWHENGFGITGPLRGESTGQWIPLAKGQWCTPLMFTSILSQTWCWMINRVADDLRCNDVHVTMELNWCSIHQRVFVIISSGALPSNMLHTFAVKWSASLSPVFHFIFNLCVFWFGDNIWWWSKCVNHFLMTLEMSSLSDNIHVTVKCHYNTV